MCPTSPTTSRTSDLRRVVTDQKPPRLEADERTTLTALLQFHRESLVRKVEDLDEEAARRVLVGSGTTLLWLVKHAARAETQWVLWSFANEVDRPGDDALSPEDAVAGVVAAYRAVWRRVDEVVTAASLEDRCAVVGPDGPINLRWVVTHLLEETARHAGHADILRELIDGRTGR